VGGILVLPSEPSLRDVKSTPSDRATKNSLNRSLQRRMTKQHRPTVIYGTLNTQRSQIFQTTSSCRSAFVSSRSVFPKRTQSVRQGGTKQSHNASPSYLPAVAPSCSNRKIFFNILLEIQKKALPLPLI